MSQQNPSAELPKIGAPAQRALNGVGITRLEHLTQFTEAEVAKLHGMGPKALSILKAALAEKGIDFAQKV